MYSELLNSTSSMILSEKVIQYISEKCTPSFKPFYLYDEEKINEHCKMFQSIPYQNKSIHFASMANINPAFLKIVKRNNLSIFVNSIGHLKAVMEAGFKGKGIIFTASAMDCETMKTVHELGVQVNLDSIGQLKQWNKLFPEAKTGIRCNIEGTITPHQTHAGFFIGKESRLGFTHKEILEQKGNPSISGLHLYAGTDIFDIDYLFNCYEELSNYIDLFPSLKYLNFGGGFGVSDDDSEIFNMPEYSKRVTALMEKLSINYKKPLKMILEPGRIIGGDAGCFVCCVNDVKKRDEMIFIGVNASSVQFPRPLLYPDSAFHPVTIIRNGKQLLNNQLNKSSVYGCSTYSRDYLAKNVMLPPIENGDIVVLGNAGSYCASSYTQFLGFEKPEEFFL